MNGDVGRRLLEIRQSLGLTQKDFGERIRVSRGYITSLEKSRLPINDRIIKLIVDTYGINEEWLKNGTGEMFFDPHNSELHDIITVFNQLNPDFQHFIIGQLKTLLEMNPNYQPKEKTRPVQG